MDQNHHLNWLGTSARILEDVTRRGTPPSPAERQTLQHELNVTCAAILRENPASQAAKNTAEHIRRILGNPAEEPLENEGMLTLEDVSRTDRLIESLETGFEHWGQELRERNASAGLSYTPPQLFMPFAVVASNRSNPYKNCTRIQRQAQIQGNPQNIRMERGQYYYAQLSAAAEAEHTGASFNAHQMVAQLPPSFDPANISHCLTAYHEIVHAKQCTQLLDSLGLQAYKAFTDDEKHNVVLNFEFEAYALMLEAADRFTQGELRRLAAERILDLKHPSVSRIMHLLRANERDRLPVFSMLQLARFFFPGGMSGANYQKTFTGKIIEKYATEARNLWIQQGARLVPFPNPKASAARMLGQCS